MRIAHLVPTLHPDGPEIGLVDLAGAARAADLDLSVVALASTSETSQVSALRRAGVRVTELGLPPWDPRAVPHTASALRTLGAELVHTHLPPADVVGAAAAVRNRIPAVSTLHRVGNEPADRLDRLRRTARILARRRFMTRTLAISQVQREWYRSLSGPDVDVEVVPNGVTDPGPTDPDRRRAQRASLEIDDADVLALVPVPMRRDQGHELLLDAVEQLPDELPLVVALAGDGPLRPWLESRVSVSGLDGRVRFVHRHREIGDLLAAADIVVHPARTGAQPTTLLRAMAAGLPVVASRVGGVPEIVTPGTGLLVRLTADAIGDALADLTVDASLRAQLGAAARARFLAEYEAGHWARRLRTVYEAALSADALDPVAASGHTRRT